MLEIAYALSVFIAIAFTLNWYIQDKGKGCTTYADILLATIVSFMPLFNIGLILILLSSNLKGCNKYI